MRQYDFSPLYRNLVGFDRMANMIDAATQSIDSGSTYPPYNVAQIDENEYRIELAVAGFDTNEIEIESHQNVLTISGNKSPNADNDGVSYLHRGIAERGFERRFQLADHVLVRGADLKNGLLVVTLQRELPEALKPRKIEIGAGTEPSDEKLISTSSSGKAEAA